VTRRLPRPHGSTVTDVILTSQPPVTTSECGNMTSGAFPEDVERITLPQSHAASGHLTVGDAPDAAAPCEYRTGNVLRSA
jgi:hypothetical protein